MSHDDTHTRSRDAILYDCHSARDRYRHELKLLSLAGGPSTSLLTTQDGRLFWPSFGKSTQRVVVTRYLRDPANGNLFPQLVFLALDGEPEAQLWSFNTAQMRSQHAMFSSDGRRLAVEVCFGADPNPDVLVLADVEQATPKWLIGRTVRMIRNPLGIGIHHPLFMPDGERLVYLRNYKYEDALEVCLTDMSLPAPPENVEDETTGPLRGVHVRRLTHDADVVWNRRGALALEPLSETVLFVRGHTTHEHEQVCAVPCSAVAEEEPLAAHSVSELFQRVESLVVAPDGQRMAFIGDGQLQVVALDGGDLTELTDYEDGPCRAVAFSPDGCDLAYAKRAGEAGDEIWVIDRLGDREPERLACEASGRISELLWL